MTLGLHLSRTVPSRLDPRTFATYLVDVESDASSHRRNPVTISTDCWRCWISAIRRSVPRCCGVPREKILRPSRRSVGTLAACTLRRRKRQPVLGEPRSANETRSLEFIVGSTSDATLASGKKKKRKKSLRMIPQRSLANAGGMIGVSTVRLSRSIRRPSKLIRGQKRH